MKVIEGGLGSSPPTKDINYEAFLAKLDDQKVARELIERIITLPDNLPDNFTEIVGMMLMSLIEHQIDAWNEMMALFQQAAEGNHPQGLPEDCDESWTADHFQQLLATLEYFSSLEQIR